MQTSQADESLSQHRAPLVHASALGSFAHSTGSTPRSVPCGNEGSFFRETLSVLPSVEVSAEEAKRGDIDAFPELSPKSSYTTASSRQHVRNDAASIYPNERDQHGSMTAFTGSASTATTYPCDVSLDTISGAVSDNDATAVSTSILDLSRWQQSQSHRNSSLSDAAEIENECTVAGAQSETRPDYGYASRSSPGSTQSSILTRCDGSRPYTDLLHSSLVLPIDGSRCHSREPSVISDAGIQQQLGRRVKGTEAELAVDRSESEQSEQSDDDGSDGASQYELQESIVNAFANTKNYQGQVCKFLPANDLYRLVEPETVFQEPQKVFGTTDPEENNRKLANEICREREIERDGKKKKTSFRKIFALLVITETVSSVRLFLSEHVSDIELPLVAPDPELKIRGLCRRNASGRSANKTLRCFRDKSWSPIRLGNFLDFQWRLLAPYFAQGKDGDVKHYPLHSQHILPFLEVGDGKNEEEKVGGYGRVFMARIHGDHHGFRDTRLSARGFAIKQQLHAGDAKVFWDEIEILKKFSGVKGHDHIVSLLATYEQFNKLHLIFYKAEGDMFAYWGDIRPRPRCIVTNVTWLARQCAGLAHGLLKLHRHLTFTSRRGVMNNRAQPRSVETTVETEQRPKSPAEKQVMWADLPVRADYHHSDATGHPTPHGSADPDSAFDEDDLKQYGRHGDINPGNILWYDDTDGLPDELTGTLKIADFGQAELNSLKSKTKEQQVANTLTYRPPECDQGQDRIPPTIRQTYDMWCLGCVYLEFITWFLGGHDLMKEFIALRMTPDLFQNNVRTDAFFQALPVPGEPTYEFMVKKSVNRFIDRLHKLGNCTDYCHDLLIIIQHDMLVIHSEDLIFTIHPDNIYQKVVSTT